VLVLELGEEEFADGRAAFGVGANNGAGTRVGAGEGRGRSRGISSGSLLSVIRGVITHEIKDRARVLFTRSPESGLPVVACRILVPAWV
jgi:hypothetical protein